MSGRILIHLWDREIAKDLEPDVGGDPTVTGQGIVGNLNQVVTRHHHLGRNVEVKVLLSVTWLFTRTHRSQCCRLPIHFDGVCCFCPRYTQSQPGPLNLALPVQPNDTRGLARQVVPHGQIFQCI